MHNDPEPKSPRGMPLFYACTDAPLITVEVYEKWYELFVIHPNRRVETLGYDKLEEYAGPDGSAYIDHVPNPRAVQRLANARGWHVHPLAFEMMVGRWEILCQDDFFADA
jgi:hypothetical protein